MAATRSVGRLSCLHCTGVTDIERSRKCGNSSGHGSGATMPTAQKCRAVRLVCAATAEGKAAQARLHSLSGRHGRFVSTRTSLSHSMESLRRLEKVGRAPAICSSACGGRLWSRS